jgi:hypothetical protein
MNMTLHNRLLAFDNVMRGALLTDCGVSVLVTDMYVASFTVITSWFMEARVNAPSFNHLEHINIRLQWHQPKAHGLQDPSVVS